MLLLELHMFYVQLYIHCTLHVCVVSLTYYKIGFPLICNMFCFIFQYVCTVNVNDNHIQNIIGMQYNYENLYAIKIIKIIIYICTHTHTHIHTHHFVHIVLFSLFTTQCSFSHYVQYNLTFMLLILPNLVFIES